MNEHKRRDVDLNSDLAESRRAEQRRAERNLPPELVQMANEYVCVEGRGRHSGYIEHISGKRWVMREGVDWVGVQVAGGGVVKFNMYTADGAILTMKDLGPPLPEGEDDYPSLLPPDTTAAPPAPPAVGSSPSPPPPPPVRSLPASAASPPPPPAVSSSSGPSPPAVRASLPSAARQREDVKADNDEGSDEEYVERGTQPVRATYVEKDSDGEEAVFEEEPERRRGTRTRTVVNYDEDEEDEEDEEEDEEKVVDEVDPNRVYDLGSWGLRPDSNNFLMLANHQWMLAYQIPVDVKWTLDTINDTVCIVDMVNPTNVVPVPTNRLQSQNLLRPYDRNWFSFVEPSPPAKQMAGWVVMDKAEDGSTLPMLVHHEKQLKYTLDSNLDWWLCEDAGQYFAMPQPNMKIPLPTEAPELWAHRKREYDDGEMVGLNGMESMQLD